MQVKLKTGLYFMKMETLNGKPKFDFMLQFYTF